MRFCFALRPKKGAEKYNKPPVPLLFNVLFSQKDDPRVEGGVAVDIEAPIDIIVSAKYNGEDVSGTVLSTFLIEKTLRFPAVKVIYLDGEFNVVKKEQAVYKAARILASFDQKEDDISLRFQTLWYLLAELLQNTLFPEKIEFVGIAPMLRVDQQKDFAKFILNLLRTELCYSRNPAYDKSYKFSVPPIFIMEEILKLFYQEPGVPELLTGEIQLRALLTEVRSYPQMPSEALTQLVIPRNPCDKEITPDIYASVGIMIPHPEVRGMGRYGARSALTASMIKQRADAAAQSETLYINQETIVAAKALAASVKEVIYGNIGSDEEGGEAYAVSPIAPYAAPPVPDMDDEVVYEAPATMKHHRNMELIFWLCLLINGDTPLKLNTPGEFDYQFGGVKMPGLGTYFAKRGVKLNHDHAKKGLQFLLAMCLAHPEKRYVDVYTLFMQNHRNLYNAIKPIFPIFTKCIKISRKMKADDLPILQLLLQPFVLDSLGQEVPLHVASQIPTSGRVDQSLRELTERRIPSAADLRSSLTEGASEKNLSELFLRAMQGHEDNVGLAFYLRIAIKLQVFPISVKIQLEKSTEPSGGWNPFL